MTRRIFKLSDQVEHPGVMLKKKYLPAIGIENQHATKLAALVQLPRPQVNKVLLGKAPIDSELAYGLARVFNTTAFFWTLMQQIYDETKYTFHNRHEGGDRKPIQGQDVEGSSSQSPVRSRRV